MENSPNYLSNLNFVGVGVSGGPDSMALLNMLKEEHLKKYNLIAIHVNYGLRESALRDQKIVEDYCQKHQIVCVSYQAPDLGEGNFQHNARNYRFRVFKEVLNAYDSNTLYLAHHQDDQLETILFQLLSHREPQYLGIKEEIKIKGLKILRPLLEWTKQEILEYCQEQQLEFGIDESNLKPVYTRNKIRLALSELSEADKESLLAYQKVYGKRQRVLKEKTSQFLGKNKSFSVDNYKVQDENLRLSILRTFLSRQHLNTTNMTKKHLKEMDKVILSNKQTIVPVSNRKSMVIEYGQVSVMETEFEPYHFKLDEYKRLDEKYFKLNEHVGTGLYVTNEDYPLVIRNAQPDDEIKLRFGTKKLNRFFIDRKIGHAQRRSWPVIENSQGIVICVAELGCDVDHYHEKYNLKLKRKNHD